MTKLTKHDIFSTPLWHIEGAPQQLIDELYEGAYKFKELYPSENRSNAGGYQSPLFKWGSFHPQGIEYIDKVVGDILKFTIESWWYNINPKGAWNKPHTHPDTDLALVLYLTETDGLLYFINPFSQRKISNFETAYAPNTSKGDILIFPSDVVHFVKPNQREEDRVSISMNLQLC